jgi:hypothetical protein
MSLDHYFVFITCVLLCCFAISFPDNIKVVCYHIAEKSSYISLLIRTATTEDTLCDNVLRAGCKDALAVIVRPSKPLHK